MQTHNCVYIANIIYGNTWPPYHLGVDFESLVIEDKNQYSKWLLSWTVEGLVSGLPLLCP